MGVKWRALHALGIKCTEDSRDIIFELTIVPLSERERAQAQGGQGQQETHKLELRRMKGEVWEFNHLGRRLAEQAKGSLAQHHIRKDIEEESEEVSTV